MSQRVFTALGTVNAARKKDDLDKRLVVDSKHQLVSKEPSDWDVRGLNMIQDGIDAVRWAWILLKFGTEKAVNKYCDWWITLVRRNSAKLPQIKTLWESFAWDIAMRMRQTETFNTITDELMADLSTVNDALMQSPRKKQRTTDNHDRYQERPKGTKANGKGRGYKGRGRGYKGWGQQYNTPPWPAQWHPPDTTHISTDSSDHATTSHRATAQHQLATAATQYLATTGTTDTVPTAERLTPSASQFSTNTSRRCIWETSPPSTSRPLSRSWTTSTRTSRSWSSPLEAHRAQTSPPSSSSRKGQQAQRATYFNTRPTSSPPLRKPFTQYQYTCSWRTLCRTKTSKQIFPIYPPSWTSSLSLLTQADGGIIHRRRLWWPSVDWEHVQNGHANGWTTSRDGPDFTIRSQLHSSRPSTQRHTQHHQCSRIRASFIASLHQPLTRPVAPPPPGPTRNRTPWHDGRQTTADSHHGSTRQST